MRRRSKKEKRFKIKNILVYGALLCVLGAVVYVWINTITGDFYREKSDYPQTYRDDNVVTEYSESASSPEGVLPEEYFDDDFMDMSYIDNYIEAKTKKEFVKNLLLYDKKLAFLYEGRWYDVEIPLYDVVLKSWSIKEYYGLDNIGFVDWAYRTATGRSLIGIYDAKAFYESNEKVSVDELQVGDMGYSSLEQKYNSIYGICVGFEGNVPVFAYCTNEPYGVMQNGCMRVSYLETGAKDNEDESPYVQLSYFIRPKVDFAKDDEKVDLIRTEDSFMVEE